MAKHPLLVDIEAHNAEVAAAQPAPPTPVEQYEDTLMHVARAAVFNCGKDDAVRLFEERLARLREGLDLA